MTDRELLAKCEAHFEFLVNLVTSQGPIERDGVAVSRDDIIVFECSLARALVHSHIERNPE